MYPITRPFVGRIFIVLCFGISGFALWANPLPPALYRLPPKTEARSEAHAAAVEALRGNDFARALELARGILALHADDSTAHLLIALAHVGLGEHASALEQARQMRGINAGHASEIYRQLCSIYSKGQRWHLAQRCLQSAAEASATTAVLEDMAGLLLARGQVKEARPILEQLPANERNLLDLSRACLKLGDYVAAKTHAQQVLATAPTQAQALLVLAGSELLGGDALAALTVISSVESTERSDPAVVHYEAVGNLILGRYQDAADRADRLLEIMPKLREAHLVAAIARQLNGDHTRTGTHAAAVLAEHPGDAIAHLVTAVAALGSGDRDAAKQSFGWAAAVLLEFSLPERVAAIEAWTPTKAGTLALAILLQADSLHRCAAQVLAREGKASVSDPLFAITRARTHSVLGQHSAASAIYETVAAEHADLVTPFLELAEEARHRGETGRMLSWLEKGAERASTNLLFMQAAGDLAYRAGELAVAEMWFRRALVLAPNSAVCHNQLAWTLLSQGTLTDEALALAQRAHELDPARVSAIDTLGWMRFQRGEHDAAYEMYAPLLRRTQLDPSVVYHAGRVCEAKSDHALAAQLLERALNVSAAFPEAFDAASRLDRLLGLVP